MENVIDLIPEEKREQVEKLLFEVYELGVQKKDCSLTGYFEKIIKSLNFV